MSLSIGELKADLSLVQQSIKKSRRLYIGRTKGRLVVQTVPKWNLFKRLYLWIGSKKAHKAYREEVLQVLKDNPGDVALHKEVFSSIASGSLPCFTMHEAAKLGTKKALFKRRISLLEVDLIRNLLQDKVVESFAEKGAYFIGSEAEKQHIIETIRQQSRPGEVTVIRNPADFRKDDLVQTLSYSPDNGLESSTGRLFGDETVSLVIDFTQMNAAQIASLNELFDTPPRFQGQTLGQRVNLVCLVSEQMLSTKTTGPGPDFWRRIDSIGVKSLPGGLPKAEHSSYQDDEALLRSLDSDEIWMQAVSTKSEAGELDTCTVDFYKTNTHWRTLLFGGLSLSAEGKIHFEEGILATFNQSSGAINCINAPWDDPEFVHTLATAVKAGGFWANGEWVRLPEELQITWQQTDMRTVNQQLATLTVADKQQPFVAINEENFEMVMADISVSDHKLLKNDTFKTLVAGNNSVRVSGSLTQSQWIRLLHRLQTLSPTPALSVDSTVKTPPGLELKRFASGVTLSNKVRLVHQHPIVNQSSAFEFYITDKMSSQTLLSTMPMLSQQQAAFDVHYTPLLDAMRAGKPVVLHGLENNPEIARLFETLLSPAPYIFIGGKRIDLPHLQVTCVVPQKSKLPGTWRLLSPSVPSTEMAVSVHQEKTITDAVKQRLHQLQKQLKSIPRSKDSRYPDIAKAIHTPEIQQKLITILLSEMAHDHSTEILAYHWRKALNDVVAKEYRGNPEVYGFVKASIAACFPDKDLQPTIDVSAIRNWLGTHPAVHRKDIKQHYWELVRHVKQAGFPLPATFSAVSSQHIDALLSQLVQCAPLDQQSALAAQLAGKSSGKQVQTDKVSMFDGDNYRRLYNALVVAGESGRLKNDKPLHQQARNMTQQLSLLPQPLAVDDVNTVLQDWFTPDLLEGDFHDLAKALVSGKGSQRFRQQRRIERMTQKLQASPVVMLKGEAGTGKTYTAHAVACQYHGGKEPLTLTLSPEHTMEDLFGREVLKPIPVSIKKEQLKHMEQSEGIWKVLCEVVGYPVKSSAIELCFDRKTCKTLHEKLPNNIPYEVIRDFQDHATEFEAGPLLQWAEMHNPPVLILDEVNLCEPGVIKPLIEALKRKPPLLSIHGRTVPLTDRHRVLALGNPESYDGRIPNPDLRNEAVPFYYRPMSHEMLSEAVLMPGFPPAWPDTLKAQANDACMVLYRHFKHVLPGHIFGPRDLKDIQARMLTCIGDEIPDDEVLHEAIWQAVSASVAGEVTEDKQRALRALDHWYHAKYPCDLTLVNKQQETFDAFYTALKQSGHADGFDFDIPSVKELAFKVWLDLEKTGGKHALVIEGEAGRGKDALLDRLLPFWLQGKGRGTGFYRINASVENWEELKQLASRAMKEGKVIVISELNTLPSRYLEGLFNEVLNGEAASGFMLVATTNPATYGGRETFSEALQSRCTKAPVGSFPENELYGMLSRKYPESEHFAHWLVSAHCQLNQRLVSMQSPVKLPLTKLLSAAKAIGSYPEQQWAEVFDQEYRLALMALQASEKQQDAPIEQTSEQKVKEARLCQVINQCTSSPVTVVLENNDKAPSYSTASQTLTLPNKESVDELLSLAAECLQQQTATAKAPSQQASHVAEEMRARLREVEKQAEKPETTEQPLPASQEQQTSGLKSFLTMGTSALARIIGFLPLNKAASIIKALPVEKLRPLFELIPTKYLIKILGGCAVDLLLYVFKYLPVEKAISFVVSMPLDKMISLFKVLPLEGISSAIEGTFKRLPDDKLIALVKLLPMKALGDMFSKLDPKVSDEIVKKLDDTRKMVDQSDQEFNDRVERLIKKSFPEKEGKELADVGRTLDEFNAKHGNASPASKGASSQVSSTRAGKGTSPAVPKKSDTKPSAQNAGQVRTTDKADKGRQVDVGGKVDKSEPARDITESKPAGAVINELQQLVRNLSSDGRTYLGDRRHQVLRNVLSLLDQLPVDQASQVIEGTPLRILGELKVRITSDSSLLVNEQIARLIESRYKQALLMPVASHDEKAIEVVEEAPQALLSLADVSDEVVKRRKYGIDCTLYCYAERVKGGSHVARLLKDVAYGYNFFGTFDCFWDKQSEILITKLKQALQQGGNQKQKEHEIVQFIDALNESVAKSIKGGVGVKGASKSFWYLLNGFRQLYQAGVLSHATYCTLIGKLALDKPTLSEGLSVEFMQELAGHPVYGKRAEDLLSYYYTVALPAERCVPQTVLTNFNNPPAYDEQTLPIRWLDNKLKQGDIHQEWSHAPTGRKPDIERLIKKEAAFPVTAQASEQPVIVMTAQTSLVRNFIKSRLQEKPIFNLKLYQDEPAIARQINRQIENAVLALFAQSLAAYKDKASWRVILPQQLWYKCKNDPYNNLPEGTYGCEALLPWSSEKFFAATVANEQLFSIHASDFINFQPRVDEDRMFAEQNQPDAIVLDTETLTACLDEFMDQLSPEMLYDILFSATKPTGSPPAAKTSS